MGVLLHNLNPTLQLQERLPGNLYILQSLMEVKNQPISMYLFYNELF